MIYLLNVQFSKPENSRKSDFYYAILWAFLNLFEDQEKVYESIIKLSFNIDDNFTLYMSIDWEDAYNFIVSHILSHPEQELSINGEKCKLKQLNFHFEILDINNIAYRDFDKFVLTFHSPTFIKQTNITYLLPNPDQFLWSVLRKVVQYYNIDVDEKDFKNRLKYTIYAGEFDLWSRLVNIKWWKKAGVVWYCTYYIKNKENEIYMKLLYIILQTIKFFGIGGSVKLWCWNVSCFISSKKKHKDK